jgi:hypothetical protein
VDGLTPAGGEYVVSGTAPRWADLEPVLGLVLAVISEDLDGFSVDADGTGPPAFGGSLDALPGDECGRTGDADLTMVEVDVPPSEVEQFTAPGSGVRSETVEGEQPVLFGGLKERPMLAGRPYLPRLGAALARP